MINENAAIYIGIVTACILDHARDAQVGVRKSGSVSSEEGYEVIGTARAKDGSSVQATHTFFVVEVRGRSGGDLVTSARLAGDSVGAQLKSKI